MFSQEPRRASMLGILSGFGSQSNESAPIPEIMPAELHGVLDAIQSNQMSAQSDMSQMDQSGGIQGAMHRMLMDGGNMQVQIGAPSNMGTSPMVRNHPLVQQILSGQSGYDPMKVMQEQFQKNMQTRAMEQQQAMQSQSYQRQSPTQRSSGSVGDGGGGKLGQLSAKYETSGGPGTIARTKGDIGGASYGSYQLTTASGHATKFANSYGGLLKGKKAGTAAFDKAWKAEASKNPEKFANAQYDYMISNHYTPAVNNIKKRTGFDANKFPKAVQEAVLSIGVQHGAGGAATLFKRAGVTNNMSAEQVLKRVYNERMKTHIYFKSSPKNIQNSVKNRFKRELNDALNML